MTIADSDVLIDFLRGREPWSGRIRLESTTGHLATTAVNSFELQSSAKDGAEREKVARLLGALTVLALDEKSSIQAADIRKSLASQGQGIGMADYLIAGICLSHHGTLLTRNQDHFQRVTGLHLSGRHL